MLFKEEQSKEIKNQLKNTNFYRKKAKHYFFPLEIFDDDAKND